MTINGFHFGGPLADLNKNGVVDEGDTIVFGVSDWARGEAWIDTPWLDSPGNTDNEFPGGVFGLVQSDGHTQIGGAPDCPLGFASYGQVAQAGEHVDASGGREAIDVILDAISPFYTSALDLQHALGSNTGHFELNGEGVLAGTEVHILVAYNWTDGQNFQIRIADVTLTNASHVEAQPIDGSGETDTADLHPVVHDLVHINTVGPVGLSAFTAHNIDFIA